ncbi:MAG: hypothetical protein WAV41_03945 [Microgenomates group bacterium]
MLVLILIITFFLNYSPILASERNIFGLHLTQTNDIYSAAKIINSSNGDWGYATIVIRLDQLNRQNWQEFMNNCRKFHIIPIIRLATIMENNYWKKPETSDIDNLASFLNSLNWPTQEQHIILFNETNHGSEWSGGVDVKSFTDISIYTYQKLKSLNSNFVVISGALDLAAPNKNSEFKSATDFFKEIYTYRPEYFDNLDALGNHYYPQNSPRDYNWELGLLKKLGVKKTFPVYITETGWPHREGETKNNQYFLAQTSANLLIKSLATWQKDPRVVAVTPFIFNYPFEPFDHFSWVDKNENLLPAYQSVVNNPKQKNTPSQITSYEITSNRLPFIILTDSEYLGEISIKNTGQSIWGETNFCLPPDSTPNVTIDQICTTNNFVYPNQIEKFSYKLKIKNIPDYKEKTFISWQGLPPLEITPLNGEGTIYSPKLTPLQRLVQYFQSWFI